MHSRKSASGLAKLDTRRETVRNLMRPRETVLCLLVEKGDVKNDSLEGATSHMKAHRSNIFEYQGFSDCQQVSITDGEKVQVAGMSTVKLKGLDDNA